MFVYLLVQGVCCLDIGFVYMLPAPMNMRFYTGLLGTDARPAVVLSFFNIILFF